MKICSKCLIEKAFNEFGPRKSSRDGFHQSCRDCIRIYKNKWANENIEKVRESKLKYVFNNPHHLRIHLHQYKKL